MSNKREASEYLTKEHGSTPNETSDSKVKMATAAQLAKRKMAAPKSRLNKPTTAATPSNPFSSSFSAPQPSQPQIFGTVGAVTFGENKSFPPGVSAPGGGFNFQPSGQSSSFTFGQPVQNNPFASLSGGSNQESSKSTEDTMMESPQKKPSFGGFGASQSANGNSLFGGFGQATQQQDPAPSQPAFSFGQPKTNGFSGSASTTLFGQPQAQSVAETPETGGSVKILFGQPPSSGPANANGLFGQSTQQQPLFGFGQSTNEAPTGSFKFGQTQSQPAAVETTKAPTFSFGQTAQPEGPPATPKFSFGQATSQSTPSGQANTPSTSLFGAPQTATPDLFAGFGSAKPLDPKPLSSEPPTANTNATSDNAGESISSAEPTTSTPQANPFAGLFARNESKDNDSPVKATETPKSSLNFAALSQPASLFGSAKGFTDTPDKKPTSDSSSTPLFGFKATEQTPTNMFSPVKSSTEASSAPSASIFGQSGTAQSEAAAKRTAEIPSKSSTGFSFGQSASPKPSSTLQPSASQSFSFGSQSFSSSPSEAPPLQSKPTVSSEPKKDETSFGTSSLTPAKTAAPSAPQSSSSSSVIKTSAPVMNQSLSSNDTNETLNQMRTMYSNPPSRIPPYLSAEQYKTYDSNYRLHSLNREFQKRIAVLDPMRDDFENIVRTYVAARESIGESIGLYTRSMAGMKRKGDASDDSQDPPSTAKKTKQSDSASSVSGSAHVNSSTASIFQPVSSASKPLSTGTFASSITKTTSPVKTPSQSDSNTPSLFKSMIPEKSNTAVTNDKISFNPFASLASTSTSSSQVKPSFSFGSTTTAQSSTSSAFKPTTADSTTPPSSPPKKSGFQMPTFAASSGGDFMSAFAKQSESSAAKLRREEKEKRKAEDFDSDEEDEAVWNQKYDEEEKAKQAKINAVTFKGFTPTFGAITPKEISSSSGAFKNVTGITPQSPVDVSSGETSESNEDGDGEEDEADEDADAEDELAEDEAEEDDDEVDEDSADSAALNSSGKSLFDRISRGPDTQTENTPKASHASGFPQTSSLFGSTINSTPEAPSFSPITPATNTPFKPATTFNFTSTPRDSPTPTPGASVFAGGTTRDGPIPGEGLFGSRSSTPVNGENPRTSLFGNLSTPQKLTGEDHTWKKGSTIKFDKSEEPPAVNVTGPSPVKETPKFGALFGTTSSGGDSTSAAPLGFAFGASSVAPAPGFLGAASHLVPASGTSSAMSSRATSPGATDNESVATNDTEDTQNDPQNSLMATSGAYPGEEDEEILFEVRAKAMRNYKEDEVKGTKKQKGWNTEGIGPMRVLKHKDTSKTRIVARAEPGAHVVLNCNLMPQITYKAAGSNIQFPVFSTDGAVQWLVKVKTAAIATELAKILEDNKGST